jgi:hypothetical protein
MEAGDLEGFVVDALPEVYAGCYEEKPSEDWWCPFDWLVEVEASGD